MVRAMLSEEQKIEALTLINMPIIEIGKEQFKRGVSESNDSSDGGFSPDGKGHNIEYEKGILAPPPAIENKDTLGSGELGLSAHQGDNGADGLFVSAKSNGDGYFYKINSDGTLDAPEEITSEDYKKNITDVIGYDTDVLVSAETDIANNADSGSADPNWWSTVAMGATLQPTPHHFIILNGDLLITNSRRIEKWDGTTASSVLLLPEEGVGVVDTTKITCFELYNNKIYICSEHGFQTESSKKFKTKNVMYVWDGINTDNTLDEKIPLPDKCYAIKNFNGRLLLFFENYIAVYNGVGFIKIKDASSIIFKSDIVQRQDKLYMAEGDNILVYDGIKFWYILGTSNDIDCIWQIWGDDLGFTSNEVVYKFDLDDFDNNGIWYSKPINFPLNTIVRNIKIIFNEDMASGDVNTLNLVDQAGDTLKPLVASYALQGAVRAVEFQNINKRFLDLQVQLNTFDNLIKRIIIEYAFTRQPIKKT